jgi:hypothetical protein
MSVEKGYAHKVYPLPEHEGSTAEQRARYHVSRAWGFYQGMDNAAADDVDQVMGRMATGFVASIELAMVWAITDGRLPWPTTEVHNALLDPDLLREVMDELCGVYGVDKSQVAAYGSKVVAS